MQIYEDEKKYGKTRNSCGYCRQRGHNRTECPEVAKDWAWWKDFTVPPFSGGSYWKSRNHPKHWGEWYTDCRDTYEKQQAKKQKSSTPVVRSAPKCGFCGGSGHNRKKCYDMQQFIKLCKKANYNYRSMVHKVLVKDLGLDVGAAVEVEEYDYWANFSNRPVGLISTINWDKINVFTAFNNDYDTNYKYGQQIEVEVLIGDQVKPVKVKEFVRCNHLSGNKHNLIMRESPHAAQTLNKILGKSECPLPEDWVNSYDDAWVFLTKKRSYAKLKKDGVVAHIEKWANKSID